MAFTKPVNISPGTYVTDGVRTGPLYTTQQQIRPDGNGVLNATAGRIRSGAGVLLSTINTYTMAPYTSTPGNVTVTNTITGSGNLVLSGTAGTTPTAPNGAATVFIGNNAQPYIQFDYPRTISVTVATANLANPTNITIFGFDWDGFPMQHTIAVQNTGTYGLMLPLVGSATAVPNKAFYGVTSVYANVIGGVGPTAGTVTLQTTNTFGLPYACQSFGDVVAWRWNGNDMRDQSGQTAPMVAGVVTVNTPAVGVVTAGPPSTLNLPLILSHGDTTGALATVGELFMQAAVSETSFTVNSGLNTDIGVVTWMMPSGGSNLMHFADATNPATGLTADVRGLIKLPETGETWAAVPNGTIRCAFTQYVLGADQYINQLAASGQPLGAAPGTWPQLIPADEYGVSQYYTGIPG